MKIVCDLAICSEGVQVSGFLEHRSDNLKSDGLFVSNPSKYFC